MEQSLPWEACSRSAAQETSRLSWNPKIYYRIQKIPQLDPNVSQMNPGHNVTPCLFNISFDILPSTTVSLK